MARTSAPDLRSIRGTTVLPGDPAYAEARLPWNLAVDQRPAAIVTPVDEADVQAVVRAARDAGLRVTAQPTGHGASSALVDTIVVRMAAFAGVAVDVDARIATVGGGARVGALTAALDGTGLVGPMGTSPTVGIAGFTLGGGQGWLSRLGGQWLRRVRLVDGTGAVRWIDDADPAMAAVRGAGGLLGIVTALDLDLLPVTTLVGGALRFAASDAPVVLAAMAGLEHAPAGLGLSSASVRMPDVPVLPEAVRGRSWFEAQAMLADADPAVLDDLRDAAPVLDDSLRPMRASEIATITNDPEAPGVSLGWSATIPALEAAVDPLCDVHASDVASPVIGIDVRLTAGIPHERPAVARLEAPWLAHAIAPAMTGDGSRQRTALGALGEALAAVSSPVVIPTFLGEDRTLELALDDAALAAVRAEHARLGAGSIAPLRLP